MTQMVIKNVTAMYPKLDRTYRFDQIEGRSVPCDPLDDGAEYLLNFMLTEEQAKELHAECAKIWKEFRLSEKKAPEKPTYMPFKKTDDGLFMGKAKIKGAYGGEPTKKPAQYGADKKLLDDDFKLTSGSTINVAISLSAYSTGMANGITARLKAVQVINYEEPQVSNPFDVVEGGFTKASAEQKAAAFEAQKPAESNPFDDDVLDEINW